MNRIITGWPQSPVWLSRATNHVGSIDWARWGWLIHPMFAFLITRAVIMGGGYIAEIAVPGQTGEAYWHAMPSNLALDVMARWDSAFYINIIRDGYDYVPGQQSSVAFFPVYPVLVKFVTPFVGNNIVTAGVIVSHLCLLGGLIFLYLFAELEFGSAAAQRTVYYIAAFPTALFFSAIYTESTFLFFSLATVYFARRRNWAFAGMMGMITSASRIVGVVIWALILFEWLRSHDWALSRVHRLETWQKLGHALKTDWGSLLWTCLTPVGLLSYMMFLKIKFGDPIAFWSVQSTWGRGSKGPFASIIQDFNSLLHQNFGTGEIFWNSLLNLIVLVLVVVLSLVVWRRMGAGYGIYSLLGILIPAESGTGSLIRYALVIFPIFMILGSWGRRAWLDRLLMIVFPVFLGIFTTIFVNWIFLA